LLEFVPRFKEKLYVIDVASVCNEKRNSRGEPMLEIFEKIVEYLQHFGIQLTEIKSFSDSSFRYHVDDKEKYFQYIDQKFIKEMPGGIKADKGILAYCLKHDNTLIISQDLMREYYPYLPYRGWILEKRIAIVVVDDEIYLIPMLDEIIPHKSNKRKRGKKDLKKNEEHSVDTLNVLKIIETSDKDLELDLYD